MIYMYSFVMTDSWSSLCRLCKKEGNGLWYKMFIRCMDMFIRCVIYKKVTRCKRIAKTPRPDKGDRVEDKPKPKKRPSTRW